MKRLLAKPLRIATPLRLIVKGFIPSGVLGSLGGLFYRGVTDALGADPVKSLIHNSGLAAVILLLITLSMSPLAKHLPCADLIKLRRLLSVYAFVAAIFHLSIYALFDLQLNLALLVNEIIQRPYITVGFATILILFALTITSFNKIKSKMGKRWQQLHNFVYLALLLALLHFSWSEKTLLQSSVYYWFVGLTLVSFRFRKFKI